MVQATITALEAVNNLKTVTDERRTQVFRATVTTDETIPLDIGTLVTAIVCKVSDGTVCTNTVATTEVTVTEAALADEDVVGFAIGAAPA